MKPPNFGPPSDGDSNQNAVAFADSVYSFVKNGVATVCTDGIPACTSTSLMQTGSCAGNAAVGANDDVFWTLEMGDNIVLGFRCAGLAEVGPVVTDGGLGPSPDLQLFATATGPVYPIVEVSTDGTNFFATGLWTAANATNPTFDLQATMKATATTMPLLYAKYVRISMIGNGSAKIDAVEALRAIQ